MVRPHIGNAGLPAPLEVALTRRAVVAVVSGGGWVIAPSADGGTSALGGRGEARFAYGRGSFRRHLGRHPQCQVVTSPGLLHDIDSFADLESARRHPHGAWLSDPE